MPGDWDALGADDRARERTPTGPDVPRHPPEPTPEQRARWSAPGYDRFRDPEHQRWAQGHRSVESLREAGRRSYAKAVERLDGMARTVERGVAYRLANPTIGERAMLAQLTQLDLQEGRDFQREYALWWRGPAGERGLIVPDMAWPKEKLAIEVHGSIRESPFGAQIAERDARKAAIYAEQGWRVLVVTERELRAEPAAARERARGGWAWAWAMSSGRIWCPRSTR